MAFDLNKGEGSTTKFNLSKSETGAIADEKRRPGGKAIYILVGLMLAAVATWYFFTGKDTSGATTSAIASSAQPENRKLTDSSALKSPGETMSASTGSAVEQQNKNADEPGAISSGQKVTGRFEAGSSLLYPDGAVVDELLKVMTSHPRRRLVISGYASSEGDAGFNQRLSGDRAEAFKKYLVEKGVAAERISTEAHGAENPVADNGSAEGRQKNRRVEITMLD